MAENHETELHYCSDAFESPGGIRWPLVNGLDIGRRGGYPSVLQNLRAHMGVATSWSLFA